MRERGRRNPGRKMATLSDINLRETIEAEAPDGFRDSPPGSSILKMIDLVNRAHTIGIGALALLEAKSGRPQQNRIRDGGRRRRGLRRLLPSRHRSSAILWTGRTAR